MSQISIFKNFNQVIENKDFESILKLVADGHFRSQVETLQKLISEGKQNEYSQKKKNLIAFTPSGCFKDGRKAQHLIEYSGIIVLDIDKIHNPDDLKLKAMELPFTYACFISPGGNGLKIFVKVDTPKEMHKAMFNKLKNFYEKFLGVDIDPSGKDITRLCFFSFDEDLYYNSDAELFRHVEDSANQSDVEKLIQAIEDKRVDITSNYEDWCNIGFALESEFGESGRNYYHVISKFNPDYNPEYCNDQYNKCLRNNSSGISIKTLFHLAKQHGVLIHSSLNGKKVTEGKKAAKTKNAEQKENGKEKKTTNRFTITEIYLNDKYTIRYNVVSNKFEYKEKGDKKYKELNENNLFIKLQKDNINISLSHLIALLKSDFTEEYNPFIEYFENLPEWDGETDYIFKLTSYLHTHDRERLEKHFKKWLIRVVRTAIDDYYHNKQALILVSNKQNSGKSTFCRFLCPRSLSDYIVENIGTDKDSLVAITENFLINLDELSTADKNEINAFKSMFSKDKIKARLTYDKRASVHVRRASFIGSTDRWEFLTDENGSVRWLCFDISFIDWKYSKEVDIDRVYAQAYHLLKRTSFNYELTPEEIEENDKINKKYQVSTPERDLIQKYLVPSNQEEGEFFTATDVLAYITKFTIIKLIPERIGKELKFLGFERSAKKLNGIARYGYFIKQI